MTRDIFQDEGHILREIYEAPKLIRHYLSQERQLA